jgi:hypothetical protein
MKQQLGQTLGPDVIDMPHRNLLQGMVNDPITNSVNEIAIF